MFEDRFKDVKTYKVIFAHTNMPKILRKKIIEILSEYPSHPPMTGTEKGINLITVNKILELLSQQKEDLKEEVEKIMINTLSADTLKYHKEVNKMYKELEKL